MKLQGWVYLKVYQFNGFVMYRSRDSKLSDNWLHYTRLADTVTNAYYTWNGTEPLYKSDGGPWVEVDSLQLPSPASVINNFKPILNVTWNFLTLTLLSPVKMEYYPDEDSSRKVVIIDDYYQA